MKPNRVSNRIYNFSPGPGMLPDSVMQQAHDEFMNWRGLGTSVIEISHRSKEFFEVAENAQTNLRDLLKIPKNYHLLFLHGGAQAQNSAIPMNLLDDYTYAAYVQTGIWGKIAIGEARRFCSVNIVASSEDLAHTYIPDRASWSSFNDGAYLHYVDNETVNGVEFVNIPSEVDVPLIVDMSSNLLTRPFDVNQFGLIYACAQKNLGTAGVTVVIVHDELLSRKPSDCLPCIFDYRLQIEKNSMVNTPATFSWYMIGLVSEWVKSEGGVQVMDKRAKVRSKLLYDYLDETEFYIHSVDPSDRSRLNIVFHLKYESLNENFLKESLKAGIFGLKGHRSIGGMRASMYNAMPTEGAMCLLDFMKDFEKRYG